MDQTFWIPLLVGLALAVVLHLSLTALQRLARRLQVIQGATRLVWFRHSPLYPVFGFLMFLFWGAVIAIIAPDAETPWWAVALLVAMVLSFVLALCVRGGTWFQLSNGQIRQWVLFIPFSPQPFPGNTPWEAKLQSQGASLIWGQTTLIHSPSAAVVNRLIDALSNRPAPQ